MLSHASVVREQVVRELTASVDALSSRLKWRGASACLCSRLISDVVTASAADCASSSPAICNVQAGRGQQQAEGPPAAGGGCTGAAAAGAQSPPTRPCLSHKVRPLFPCESRPERAGPSPLRRLCTSPLIGLCVQTPGPCSQNMSVLVAEMVQRAIATHEGALEQLAGSSGGRGFVGGKQPPPPPPPPKPQQRGQAEEEEDDEPLPPNISLKEASARRHLLRRFAAAQCVCPDGIRLAMAFNVRRRSRLPGCARRVGTRGQVGEGCAATRCVLPLKIKFLFDSRVPGLRITSMTQRNRICISPP